MDRDGFFLAVLVLSHAFVSCWSAQSEVRETQTDKYVNSPPDFPLSKDDGSSVAKSGGNLIDRVEVSKLGQEIHLEPGNLLNSTESASGISDAENGRVEGSNSENSSLERNKVLDSSPKPNNELNPKETLRTETDKNVPGEESQMKGEAKQDDKDEVVNKELEPKMVPIEGTEKGASSSGKRSRKENPRAEECDNASNRCMDEKNNLIACLRVPGSESPHFSLLIQNKGTGALNVKITGPDFVSLEHTEVHLQEQADKKVKVSIVDVIRNNSEIVLTTGNGRCSLPLRDTISHNSGQISLSQQLTSGSFITRTSAMYCSLVVVLIIGAAWMCLRFRRRRHSYGTKYQQMETILPVSSGGNLNSDTNDVWDNSWGDSWDDEEAPITPSKPVQTLSSKGLASRRSSKEGWENNWKD